MKKERLLVLLLVLSLCFSASIHAETIILKSGEKKEGEIVERTDRYIKIQISGVPIPITYFLDDIEDIESEAVLEDTSTLAPKPVRDYSREKEDVNLSEKIYFQKDGLFKMSVFSGWGWTETPGMVSINNPKGDNGIFILFKPMPTPPDEKVKEVLKGTIQTMVNSMVKPANGKVLNDKGIQIDGVYAHRLDFLLTIEGETGTITAITFLNRGYAFTITFGGAIEEERLEMEKMIETFQFQ